MKKIEATSVEAILASAPPEAEVITPAVKDKTGQLELVKFLSDYQEHDSGVIATALYGKATAGTRGKMRELIEDINQATLEGKGQAFVYHTQHGKYQLKKAATVEVAEEMNKAEYKDPARKQK